MKLSHWKSLYFGYQQGQSSSCLVEGTVDCELAQWEAVVMYSLNNVSTESVLVVVCSYGKWCCCGSQQLVDWTELLSSRLSPAPLRSVSAPQLSAGWTDRLPLATESAHDW